MRNKILPGMLALLLVFTACKKEAKPTVTATQPDAAGSIEKKKAVNTLGGILNMELDNSDPAHPYYFASAGCTIVKIAGPTWDTVLYPDLQTGVPVRGTISLADYTCGSSLDLMEVPQPSSFVQFTVSTVHQSFPDLNQIRSDLSYFKSQMVVWYATFGPTATDYAIHWETRPKMSTYVQGSYTSNSEAVTVQRLKIIRRDIGSNEYHLALAPADYQEPPPGALVE